MVYWQGTPEQFQLVQEVQNMKREGMGLFGISAIHSDQYVMTNPITGQNVPVEDLRYAKEHMFEIYQSGEIRNERWAFLWYH